MSIITVTAGHNSISDPGAVNGSVKEAEIATDMRNMVVIYLERAGVTVRTDGEGSTNLILSQAVKLIADAALAVEFHCNAGPKTAKGVEALSQPKHKAISQELCAAVASIMGSPLRGDAGWKAENSGQHSRLAYVSGGGIILELFFISNDAELAIWQQKKWLIAKAVAQVLIDYAESKA